MKLVRFSYQKVIEYGILKADEIQVIQGDIFGDYQLTPKIVATANVKLLAPCIPTKAVCMGLNYHDHAKEMKSQLPEQPLIFIKPSSALSNPNDGIEYPSISHNLHYEAELAIVIKKKAKKVSAEKVSEYILGYTCANDVTARDIQKGDGQWTRGKSCDTFLPLGPCIETDINPHNIDIKLYLNNVEKQSSNTSNLIFKVPELVAFITQSMTLNPGDVILTGTPSGVGPMQVGDTVTVELTGIGKLTNIVVKG
jgi:2-keto-4-pentenoate hydratase/2-oxohepta-3-ene-1,7-dioic acid hydratase in catechol pathway